LFRLTAKIIELGTLQGWYFGHGVAVTNPH
jgi:hypothetical protein